MYEIRLSKSAAKDTMRIKNSNLEKSFLSVIEQLKLNPYEPTQRFEKLKPPGNGLYSRRINRKDRVVYSIDENKKIVTIYSVLGHY